MKVWKIKRFCKRVKFAAYYGYQLAKCHHRHNEYKVRDNRGFWKQVNVFTFYFEVMKKNWGKIW